jgi:hypothetical protein
VSPDDKRTTGTCSTECYQIEARITHDLPPCEIAGQLVDGVWRTVRTTTNPIVGVPVQLWNAEAKRMGYLTYEAAMSLAYWFAAFAEASCVEIRLVRYKFDYHYSISREAEEAPIAHGGLRRHTEALVEVKGPASS